jgi:aspartyl-tRNA(Asn)/glutamyl-tRNA(Gln) amidotransferase subunit B
VLRVDDAWIARVKAALPELPMARAERYQKAGVSAAEALLLTDERGLADYFDRCAPLVKDQAKLAKRIVNELLGAVREAALTIETQKVTPENFAALLALVDAGDLSSSAAKDVLSELVTTGGDPAAVADRKGLRQVSDAGATLVAVETVLARSADEIARYKSGKTQLLGFFVGQAMKEMKGKGNPALIGELVKKKLGG